MPQALLMRTEPTGDERPVWAGSRSLTIGRDAANEVMVDEPPVSRW